MHFGQYNQEGSVKKGLVTYFFSAQNGVKFLLENPLL